MHQCYLISYGYATTSNSNSPNHLGGFLDMHFKKPEVEFVGTIEQCRKEVKKLQYMTLYTIGD
jgi:hypothetical protein